MSAEPRDLSRLVASRWLRRLVEAAIYLIPAAVLLWLDHPALGKTAWSDEWATVQFSGLTWHDLRLATSHVDHFLLPYYALVHVVRDLGGGLHEVRVLSLISGVIAVVATQLVARRIWGRIAALTAGLMLAVNPFFCLWVSQGRPPAVGYAAVAVSTLLVVFWWRVSPFVYPFVLTLGSLLFPPVALALVPHLYWRWRAAGWRSALRLMLQGGAGIAVVVGWELLTRHQIAALKVASEGGPSSFVGALNHALGAKGWLPALHAAALVAALVVLFGHRGPSHRQARRGLVLAVLLADGTAALAWLATLGGVPMLADNLLVSAPIGSALLLAGLIGHRWFPLRSPDSEADVGLALRGGFAAASALTLAFAGSWWISEAKAHISADGMELVAPLLVQRVQVGDVIVFQQPYATVGYTYSLAAAVGDDALRADLVKQLPYGAHPFVVRRVTGLDVARTRLATVATMPDGGADRVWVVRLPADPANEVYRSVLECADPQFQETPALQTYLDLYVCEGAR